MLYIGFTVLKLESDSTGAATYRMHLKQVVRPSGCGRHRQFPAYVQ